MDSGWSSNIYLFKIWQWDILLTSRYKPKDNAAVSWRDDYFAHFSLSIYFQQCNGGYYCPKYMAWLLWLPRNTKTQFLLLYDKTELRLVLGFWYWPVVFCRGLSNWISWRGRIGVARPQTTISAQILIYAVTYSYKTDSNGFNLNNLKFERED